MEDGESSLIMVSSRPPSLRSMRPFPGDPQVLLTEPDTFCVLPSRMRVLCMILTVLLISSLFAAIANSLQNAHAGSSPYCKAPTEEYSVKTLCPKETMFKYYKCCDISPSERFRCCVHFKLWLLAAIGCVCLSVVVGVGYTLLKYVVQWRHPS